MALSCYWIVTQCLDSVRQHLVQPGDFVRDTQVDGPVSNLNYEPSKNVTVDLVLHFKLLA